MRAPVPELLAPAGGREAAYAAFAFGADAVYTGLSRFSARAEALNLSPAELEEITAYAHSLPHPRRVYVTLNTLLREDELPPLIEALAVCEGAGVDALIVQDLGVARIAHRHFPNLRLHASTQLAIHNLEGVRAAARLGFQRVTMARELTLDELRAIARHAPAEIEAFLHGALCYSYSGLCLYSALLRDRSGNRGACAYPCRDLFSSVSAAAPASPALCFSMKDLAAAPLLPDLLQTGVASLKIEGRKKSPLYVAVATHYYRHLLDRSFAPGQRESCENDLRSVFSRPWTPLHLRSRHAQDVIDPSATGHRGTPLGHVEWATRQFIQFKTRLPLALHDGIQFEPPNSPRPFGFAVEAITLSNGRRVFEAPAGSNVEIPLPPHTPFIAPDTPLFLSSSQAVKQRYRFPIPNPSDLRRRYPLSVTLLPSPDASSLTATASAHADGHPLTATASLPGPFPPAKNPEVMARALHDTFSKLGDTPFSLHTLTADAITPLFIPLSKLNALRRTLLDTLQQNLTAARTERTAAILAAITAEAAPDLSATPNLPPPFLLKTDQPSVLATAFPDGQIPHVTELILELNPADTSIEAIETLRNRLPSTLPLRLALPLLTRAWEREPLLAQIRHFLDHGQLLWEASNLSAFDLLPAPTALVPLDLTADWPLYTLNTQALAALAARHIHRFTLSPEDTFENITRLATARPGRLVWPVRRDPPLFISENCPHAARLGHCEGPASCPFREETLISKAGEKVLLLNRHCRFHTLMEKPQTQPIPPGLPVIPRADFLLRPILPGTLRHDLFHLAAPPA